ncbi:MAG: hypothetical protein Q4E17_07505, partial [Synergistes sp.]|nr:hypothetical protein [Synergistes sp.]
MKDENIATPEVTLTYTGSNGEKLSVDYKNATIGDNMYLSALLYDETGQLINYAKVVNTRNSGSGKAEIPLYNLPAGNYRIRFFCEEINDGIQPDYASEPSREFAIKSSGMFKTLNDLPKLAGNSSTTVLYDGKRWAKLSDTRLLMVDTLGVKSWSDAVSCGKNYASGITDTFESKIKKSSALLTAEEANMLAQSARCFGKYWWLSTNNNSRVPYGVSGMGEIVTMRNRSTSETRPALTLGNTDDIWFLSAVHGAKSAAPGRLVVAHESGREWKITYKDKTLPAPIFSGPLTLDAAGNSKWSNPNDERIAALIGADGADAKGYMLLRDKNGGENGEILLNGVTGENVYIHTEIIAPGYDR